MSWRTHDARAHSVDTAPGPDWAEATPHDDRGVPIATEQPVDQPAQPPVAQRILRPCAGGIAHDDAGRILLILRGTAPSAGTWSVPGGRCHADESPAHACVRELAEETGLVVVVDRWAGRVVRDAPDGSTYVIDDYVCHVTGGELRAGDDASDARWVNRAEFDALDLAPGVFDALDGWGLLPR